MEQRTFESMKRDAHYKKAIPFIENLLKAGIPLSAILTNDWHCNLVPREYVTREYGRSQGGQSNSSHQTRLGIKSAKKLAEFYLK